MVNESKKLDDLKLPALPELNAGYVVIQKEAWTAVTDYVRLQTSTINALTVAVKSLENLCNLRAVATDNHLIKLEYELAEIAQALEGVYIDE